MQIISRSHHPLLLSPEQVKASTNQILESKACHLQQELIKLSVKVQLYFFAQYLNEESYNLTLYGVEGDRELSRQAKGQEARSLNGYFTIYSTKCPWGVVALYWVSTTWSIIKQPINARLCTILDDSDSWVLRSTITCL